MRAIDTNIVVRLIAQDDPKQTQMAQGLLDEELLILPTVLMEAVWVLSSTYKMSRSEISGSLRTLLGYPLAQVVSGESVLWALDSFDAGADFADMLHVALASEAGASSFATFEKHMATRIETPVVLEKLV